ncbi:MAG: RdgB/HAM1 family non-canonical purine NTP pyrophosphatase [Luminiphilus sp.]|nr:RdgB/HAM1 family non-canonical purine NTP pyrophosphatase [Luminiphilus sp.]MDG1460675.1 RdgB/HAM1 family non-canonical purine NTP pyrophosphatase [Luminiphilus sp.]
MTGSDTITLLASGNAGKLKELRAALSDTGLMLQPQSDFDVPEADEDGLTFVENALKKARNASLHTGLPALADDSGLVVPALGGAPGIHSARFSGQGDGQNNIKLLQEMLPFEGDYRKAWFICVLVRVTSATDPTPLIAEGYWHGHIAKEPSGASGFGYDPLFQIDSTGRTAADLNPKEKQALSHRGQAVRTLRHKLEH